MKRSGLFAAAALGMLAASNLPTTPAQGPEAREGQQAQRGGDKNSNATTLAERLAIQRAMSRGISPPPRGGYKNRAGWTNRGYQRAAAKKRNQARHRAACRRSP